MLLLSECQKRSWHLLLRFLIFSSFRSLTEAQDNTVIIWLQDAPGQPWQKQLLKPDPFPDTVWRVSWSLSGGILAVSCGDNKVTLWREGLKGEWENVHQVE
jgi:protein transport protein SEC13